jgi:hypothetical protein
MNNLVMSDLGGHSYHVRICTMLCVPTVKLVQPDGHSTSPGVLTAFDLLFLTTYPVSCLL